MESKDDCVEDYKKNDRFDNAEKIDDTGYENEEIGFTSDFKSLEISPNSTGKMPIKEDILIGETKERRRKASVCDNCRPRSSTISPSNSEDKDSSCLNSKTTVKKSSPEIVDKVIEMMLGSEMTSQFEEFARANIGPFQEYAKRYDDNFHDPNDDTEYSL